MHEKWGLNKEAFKRIVASKVATRENISRWLPMIKEVVDETEEVADANEGLEKDDQVLEVDMDLWEMVNPDGPSMELHKAVSSSEPSVSWTTYQVEYCPRLQSPMACSPTMLLHLCKMLMHVAIRGCHCII